VVGNARNDTSNSNHERKVRIPKHDGKDFTTLSSAGAEVSFDTGTPFVKTFTFGIQRTSPPEAATTESQGDISVLTLTDWRELSACRDSDPDIFFPVGTTGPAVNMIEKATTVCAVCTVQEECLLYALETNQEAGVWGGLPEDDRRRYRKRWLAERRRQRQAS